MTIHVRVITCVLACMVATAASGCSSMTTIKPATQRGAPVFGKVKAGDTVKVRLQDGRSVRFVVQQVDGDALVSRDGTRYMRNEIAHLQRRSTNVAGTVLVSAVVGFLLAALAFENSDPVIAF